MHRQHSRPPPALTCSRWRDRSHDERWCRWMRSALVPAVMGRSRTLAIASLVVFGARSIGELQSKPGSFSCSTYLLAQSRSSKSWMWLGCSSCCASGSARPGL
eukprot:7036711-Prymnesium_polylepis.1